MTPRPDVSTLTGAPVAVTMGDPSGIGPDVILGAWAARERLRLPAFYVLGDADLFRRRAVALGLAVPVMETDQASAALHFTSTLPVVDLGRPVAGLAGQPSPEAAPVVLAAIETAVADVRAGKASAIVTNPISKHVLYEAGFTHPGHTEFLGELALAWGPGPEAGRYRAVMMLAGPELRTVPVTIHIPLADVAPSLTTGLIVSTVRIVAEDLTRRFRIAAPRIAVAGLNPHAGENGAMGTQDIAIIAPAVRTLSDLGINAVGPLPADTMFQPRMRQTYDAAICMYHDQALIPVKTIAFDETVNVTLGLPFVRTSPDHGTAFDIAGTGAARCDSFIAALRMARDLSGASVPVAAV